MAQTQVIDYYNDISKQLFYKIGKNYTIPEFVKQASDESYEDISGLPSEDFADQARHKLPCHTKSAVWLSGTYFLENYDAYSPRERNVVINNLVKKASEFGISDLLADVFEKKAQRIAKNDNMQFALSVSSAGETVNLFPINNQEAITKSAAALLKNRGRYTFEMRKTASRAIISAAGRQKVNLPGNLLDELTKSAGYGISMPSHIKKAIGERVYLVKNANKNKSCQGLAKIGIALPENDINLEVLTKLASAIEGFDVLNKLTHLYGRIKTPEEICFHMSVEKMSSYKDDHMELRDGTLIKVADVTNIDINDLRNVMGEKIASAFAPAGVYDEDEIKTILPSLPVDELSTFKTLLNV